MIALRREVACVELLERGIPRWYGIAWHDLARMSAVCYPVPFHHLAGFLRDLGIRFLAAHRSRFQRELEQTRFAAFWSGYDAGCEAGRRSMLHQVQRFVEERGAIFERDFERDFEQDREERLR